MEPQFIEKRMKAIEQRQDEQKKRVDNIEHNAKAKFDELQMYVTRTQGLAEKQLELLRDLRSRMDSRFDQVNERFERVDGRIDGLHREITELDLTVKTVQKKQDEHGKKLDSLDSKMDQLLQLLQSKKGE